MGTWSWDDLPELDRLWATPAAVGAAVGALLATGHADYVVHNDLAARTVDGELPATLYAAGDSAPVACPTRAALAGTLEETLAGAVPGALSSS